jgi:hypothetical protein
MKSRTLTCIITITLFTALAAPVPLPAEEQSFATNRRSRCGSVTGPYGWIISSEGWMVWVLGNFHHTRFLFHTCLQQTPPAEATL